MEIKVISRETIKPSKPTPQENKMFKLSSFDVLYPNTYFPLILFYPQFPNPNNLKHSLSETLTIFYPLAGRRHDVVSVACNDEGALYYEATVNTSMSDFLDPPKLESLDQLLPCQPCMIHPQGESLPQLQVQVNTFECGGVAIGMCNLHTIMDASSCRVLARTWSAICRNKREEIEWPDFDSAFALFPPRDISAIRAGLISSPAKVEVTTTIRRFVFTEEAMSNLRVEAKEDDDDGASANPTRYQVLSSFIAKHLILARRSKGIRSAILMHIMDVRRRRGDPLTSNSMGNLVWPAMIPCDIVTYTDNDNNNVNLKDLVKTTRQKIGSINKDLFLRIQTDPDFLQSDEFGELLLEGIEKKKPIAFVFSSWLNLGFNELDFGAGKPLWVGFRGGTQETVPDSVILIDTSQGLEAWITMPEENMAVLEEDEEFLRFALLNPPVSCQ
ncbi:stemmadenine O-acetyltransferase-like [Prosopis cineraria]|uniref:stemmadenine O-acetyltransferase-like n=1 Tax=Prosopis cineraria TaxID=364024 RepID=UPI0024109E25|nr:stemmadenine O-acetyltransferase-like [Prosopis cineraria]